MTDVIDRIEVEYRFSDLPIEQFSSVLYRRMRRRIGIGWKIALWIALVAAFVWFLKHLERQGMQGSEVARYSVAAAVGSALTFFTLLLANTPVYRRMIRSMRDAPMRQSGIKIVFDAKGLTMAYGAGSHGFVVWRHVEDILAHQNVTLLLTSAQEYIPVPHGSLPEGITPAAFTSQIETWRRAAQ